MTSLPFDATGRNEYEPLRDARNQIRLLYVQAGEGDDVVNLAMTTWSLADPPSYLAISYTWGFETTRQLYLHGKSVGVRQNCYYALWQARHHFPNKYFWLDSLCINQSDTEEKNEQVQLMYSIYSQAERVLSCVGDHANGSQIILEHSLRLAADDPACIAPGASWVDDYVPTSSLQTWLRGLSETELKSLCLQYNYFASRPYWTRLWVVPEMLAGARETHDFEVLCGTDIVPWKAIYKLGQAIQFQCNIRQDDGWNVDMSSCLFGTPFMMSVSLKCWEQFSIDDTIERLHLQECSDPRDRVYAILPFIDVPDPDFAITPDYDRTYCDLFLDLVRWLDLDNLPRLMHLFKLDYQDPYLQAKVKARQLPAGTVTSQQTPFQVTLWGGWTLNEQCRAEITASKTPSRPVNTALLKDRKEREILASLCPPLSTSDGDRNFASAQPVLVVQGDSLAAVLCPGARSGDTVVSMHMHSSTPEYYRVRPDEPLQHRGPGQTTPEAAAVLNTDTLLVLRHTRGETYDVVGQGFKMAAYYELPGATDFDSSENGKFSVSVIPDDLLVIAGQDLLSDGDYCVQSRVERIFTKPVLQPGGAAIREH